MFLRKKEKEELQRLLISNLETNNALIASSLNRDVTQVTQQKRSELVETNMDPVKAAYALNLCTVSVSQIIDYEDLVVLEQEYENILNNLNLENMPKDEPLLHILKEILDTITFFRIQAGDKKIVEKEYQQRLKSAIWSAVPSFGMFVGGNPWLVLGSLATQVGAGYMNYRKTKAETDLEHEKQMWQLQRSAIEQLNGLRRELFDTSWRLSKKYKFQDELRLTEKQINQYNEILMDPDDMRRYERLEYISTYFDAYPPFWYYFGHAANLVSKNAGEWKRDDVSKRYRELAMHHFSRFKDSNDMYSLLREDLLNSTCALEYIELLDAETDKELIAELLSSAVNSSGRAYDILQLCAMAYLRIGNSDEAIKWLKYLVNENYNATTNAQLLSYIYVDLFIKEKKEEVQDKLLTDYHVLASRIEESYLFPIPDVPIPDDRETKETKLKELTEEFIESQRVRVLNEYYLVLVYFFDRYNKRFNQIIPEPEEGIKYNDSFWSDQTELREERLNTYKLQFNTDELKNAFVDRLENASIFPNWISLFNEMLSRLSELAIENSDKGRTHSANLIMSISDEIAAFFGENATELGKLQEKMNNDRFEVSNFEELFAFSFEKIVERGIKTYREKLHEIISKMEKMSEFANSEYQLEIFCKKNDIPNPNSLFLQSEKEYSMDDFTYLSAALLQGEAFEEAKHSELINRMCDCIERNYLKVIQEDGEKIYHILRNGNSRLKYKQYFKKKKYHHNYQKILIGAIVDTDLIQKSIVFTTKGVIEGGIVNKWKDPKEPKIYSYEDVKYNQEEGYLDLAGNKYKNKHLNLDGLYTLIQELKVLQEKYSSTNGEIVKEPIDQETRDYIDYGDDVDELPQL